jgi:hypothetical protein
MGILFKQSHKFNRNTYFYIALDLNIDWLLLNSFSMVRQKILILNGPNLNLLGTREPEIYGQQTFEQYLEVLRDKFEKEFEIFYFQSNEEGADH